MSENKRVAIYLRFELMPDEQATSFMLYCDYYKSVIKEHEGWQLTEFYVDEGPAKNQEEFKRLLHDCKSGKIDLVYARSTARFGKNVIDAIQTAQDLSHLEPPVGVFFEQENLDSLDKDSYFMLSVWLLFGLAERQHRSEIQKRARQRKLDSLSRTKEEGVGND
jgi:DNA invertase Pin-like site-specific DNA recombinase